ncbi:hypothetical protein BDQ17DRAFT_1486665, partial [Cyathus striatus]
MMPLSLRYFSIHTTICADFIFNHGDNFADFLESLATRKHAAVRHATKVSIPLVGPLISSEEYYNEETAENEKGYNVEMCDPDHPVSQRIKKLLPRAIAAFKKATTVRWVIENYATSEWTRDWVISGIAQMPSLTTLGLTLEGETVTPIHIHSIPQSLESFWIVDDSGINVLQDGRIEGIPEVIAKSSGDLHIIQYLPVDQKPDLTLVDDIWKGLKRERILLTNISLEEPTETFIQYLKSYSGLNSRTIMDALWVPRDGSE